MTEKDREIFRGRAERFAALHESFVKEAPWYCRWFYCDDAKDKFNRDAALSYRRLATSPGALEIKEIQMQALDKHTEDVMTSSGRGYPGNCSRFVK
jgi:hypothetical protein